jgi:hypothetical protein
VYITEGCLTLGIVVARLAKILSFGRKMIMLGECLCLEEGQACQDSQLWEEDGDAGRISLLGGRAVLYTWRFAALFMD